MAQKQREEKARDKADRASHRSRELRRVYDELKEKRKGFFWLISDFFMVPYAA